MSIKLFHLSVVLVNTFALWYDQMYIDIPYPAEELYDLPFKGRGLFLTIWCMWIQTLYFSIAILNDVIGTDAASPKKTPFIRRIRDFLFPLAFTLALFVSLSFWGLCTVNKEAVFPDYIEKLYPVWFNHVMHTTIVPFILIELFLSNITYPSRNVGLSVTVLFNLAYLVWMLEMYRRVNVWVYPLFGFLNWPQRIFFFVISAFIIVFLYSLGAKLNSIKSSSNKSNSSRSKRH